MPVSVHISAQPRSRCTPVSDTIVRCQTVSDTIWGCQTPVEIRRARFGQATVPLDDDALVVTSRAAFDAALLTAAERAGASIERTRVVDLSIDRTGVDVMTPHARHRASWIVGADGANSLVRRRVARAFGRRQLSIATGFYARGVTCDEIVIEFTADPPGYIWSFPRADHLAIGICAQADAGTTSAALRARTADWVRGSAAGLPVEAAEPQRWVPYSWPIPSLTADDFERLDFVGPRWMLVGDAAGLVDPITREGIFFALQSAEFAAAALGAKGPATEYAARLRDDTIAELTLAARLKSGFFTPPFVRLLVNALERSAPIRAVMADLIAGRQRYRTLKWRLTKTFEIGLAWKALNVRLKPDATWQNNRPAL